MLWYGEENRSVMAESQSAQPRGNAVAVSAERHLSNPSQLEHSRQSKYFCGEFMKRLLPFLFLIVYSCVAFAQTSDTPATATATTQSAPADATCAILGAAGAAVLPQGLVLGLGRVRSRSAAQRDRPESLRRERRQLRGRQCPVQRVRALSAFGNH